MTATAGIDSELDYRRRLRDALSGITPAAVAEWERVGHLPRRVLADLAAADVFRGRWAPGAQVGIPMVVAMAEESAEICSGLALAAMGHSEIFIGGLHWLGTTEWHRTLLDDALAGRAIGCFGSTEPQGGSDLAGIRTTATRTPEGWHLRGRKRYVSNLGAATHVVAVARVEGSQARDLALFVVPLDHAGVRVHGFFEATGVRACDVGEVSFDEVLLPPEALLGTEGMGLAYASRLLQFERLSICAQLLTAVRQSIGLTAAHARRRLVGGVPLLDKQVVRHRLATATARLGVADAALRDVVARGTAKLPFAHQVAALKLVVGELASEVTDGCLQLFGARGYTGNFPLERWWRDVRLARIGGGADEVLTEAVASRLRLPDARFDAALDRYEAADIAR
ncbi:acyl-CoA dehydrogenase family protein [Actinokineospora sp.]|uniref:acyl-CoA dehydrogenase family protein n=1 Tax=Actinokineospora sp. TaxID=1872133 RepID=UPI0040380B77